MKIAIITDIHHGPQSHTKEPGWDALQVMRDCIWHAGEQGADLLLDLGDRISDTTREADRQVAAEVAATFATFNGPRYHVLGNHDVATMSIADNEEILGQSMQSAVVDLGEARLILWQPGVKIEWPTGFPHAAANLDWLVEPEMPHHCRLGFGVDPRRQHVIHGVAGEAGGKEHRHHHDDQRRERAERAPGEEIKHVPPPARLPPRAR